MSKKWIFLVKIQNTEILSKNTGIQNIFLISNTKYRNTKYRNTEIQNTAIFGDYPKISNIFGDSPKISIYLDRNIDIFYSFHLRGQSYNPESGNCDFTNVVPFLCFSTQSPNIWHVGRQNGLIKRISKYFSF